MTLIDELIKGLLPENEEKTVAIYAGGFKPPTRGHFEVVKQALEEHPNIDELLIYIGKKERDGITQAQSLLVWEIYANYLPLKVELIPTSTPPIKAVYNYAKNNPETSVLWIIGAREGDDGDFKDIADRTKNVDNYSNIALAVTITTNTASGTAARNAAKISIEKLKPLLPDELKDEEVLQVFDIIKENTAPNHDGKAAPYGSGYKEVDEGRKKKKVNEKKGFGKSGYRYRSIYKKNGKFYFMQDNPFSPGIRQEFGPYKTKAAALRKMGSFPPGTSYRDITENASYSNDIDFKRKIVQLTKHMIDKGMNIQPLPKVEFVNGDSENARDFFGKTAYYTPDTQTIVLYTEGRHPKDIVRSFAHEMIHHIQYLENRLGNINTTDTTEDEHLDKLEREANLRGTMTFRNWTDSIVNEGYEINAPEAENAEASFIDEDKPKVKDPFGLNAYARELATLREDEDKYYIYLDMDGVVADFDNRFKDLSGMMPQEYVDKYGKNDFWDLIDEKHKVSFWRGIEIMPGAKKLVNYVSQYPYEMLTAPSVKKQSVIGKSLWVKDKVGTLYPSKPKVTYRSAKQKHTVKPKLTKFDILIDDKGSTIDRWDAAGGTAIFYQNADQVINDLKKLGL